MESSITLLKRSRRTSIQKDPTIVLSNVGRGAHFKKNVPTAVRKEFQHKLKDEKKEKKRTMNAQQDNTTGSSTQKNLDGLPPPPKVFINVSSRTKEVEEKTKRELKNLQDQEKINQINEKLKEKREKRKQLQNIFSANTSSTEEFVDLDVQPKDVHYVDSAEEEEQQQHFNQSFEFGFDDILEDQSCDYYNQNNADHSDFSYENSGNISNDDEGGIRSYLSDPLSQFCTIIDDNYPQNNTYQQPEVIQYDHKPIWPEQTCSGGGYYRTESKTITSQKHSSYFLISTILILHGFDQTMIQRFVDSKLTDDKLAVLNQDLLAELGITQPSQAIQLLDSVQRLTENLTNSLEMIRQ
jgi:hypothetical protein